MTRSWSQWIADHAGCSETRRSTSSGVIQVNGHVLSEWSTTQSTVALSSGASEFVAIVKGVVMGLFTRNLLNELGWCITMRPEINSNDFGVFLELISRFEFEFRRRENFFFFEGFEFLVCSCECAVAFLCPRNSISNVAASAIHDDK